MAASGKRGHGDALIELACTKRAPMHSRRSSAALCNAWAISRQPCQVLDAHGAPACIWLTLVSCSHRPCRILTLHDPDCYAAAKKALAKRYTAGSLWGVGLLVALLTALAAGVVIHSRQLTAAGFVVWRRSGEDSAAPADGEYDRLVDAAEVQGTPSPPRAE